MEDYPIVDIPTFSLERQISNIRQQLLTRISEIVDSGQFILGKYVRELESKIANYCGLSFGIGVANGSDALYLALQALNISQGDEVITSPFTFFATAGAISRLGAKPVFVDIAHRTWNIDPNLIEDKITAATKAIIPVHLYGCPADMLAITDIAKKHDLWVIEDCAQAFGAKIHDQYVGSMGDVACFSFFPTKVLGALGDGGMVLTQDENIFNRIQSLRTHGARVKYYHDEIGCNSRLDEIQAAILDLKLQFLAEWLRQRRQIAALYSSLLKQVESAGFLSMPIEPEGFYHVYHQYTIATHCRDDLQKHLRLQGIGSAIYYPVPLHLQKAYSSLKYLEGHLPIAEKASREVISLPMFPELYESEIQRVAKAVIDFFKY